MFYVFFSTRPPKKEVRSIFASMTVLRHCETVSNNNGIFMSSFGLILHWNQTVKKVIIFPSTVCSSRIIDLSATYSLLPAWKLYWTYCSGADGWPSCNTVRTSIKSTPYPNVEVANIILVHVLPCASHLDFYVRLHSSDTLAWFPTYFVFFRSNVVTGQRQGHWALIG